MGKPGNRFYKGEYSAGGNSKTIFPYNPHNLHKSFLKCVLKKDINACILSFAAKIIKQPLKSSYNAACGAFSLCIFLLCFLPYFVYCKIFFIDDRDIYLELKSNPKIFSMVLKTSS